MTPKEEIQQEFKKCFDRINVLIAGLADAPAEPTKVEVGKVYRNSSNCVFMVTDVPQPNRALGYGFDYRGGWTPLDRDGWSYSEATPVPISEWTELLDKERIKQGLVAGAKIERPEGWTGLDAKIVTIDKKYMYGRGFSYKDEAANFDGYQIYKNGIWAKVIKDEDIYVDGEKVVFEGSLVTIGGITYSNTGLVAIHSLDRETFDKIVGRLKHA